MKTHTAEVKSGRKSEKREVVGVAEYMQFDSVNEAVAELGEATCLELVNAQVKTNALNQVRAQAVGEPSVKMIRDLAMSKLTPQDWASVAGDMNKINELVSAKMVEVKAELEAQRQARIKESAGKITSADDDDDEDDEA